MNLFHVSAWLFLGLAGLAKSCARLVPSLPRAARFVWIALFVAALLCVLAALSPIGREHPAGAVAGTIWLLGCVPVLVTAVIEAMADARRRW